MKIRIKLALRFTAIVSMILVSFALSVYFLSSNYREKEFYSRLKDKAVTTAKLFSSDVKEVDPNLLKIIGKNSSDTLINEEIAIYSIDNKLLYRSNDKIKLHNDFLSKISPLQEIHGKAEGEEVIGILFKGSNDTFKVIASAYDRFGLSKLNFLKYILFLGILLAIIITVVVGVLFSKQSLAPISDVISQIDRITATNLNLRIDEGNRSDEIAQLSIRFNQMLQRLEKAFAMQRNFVLNASHELRTPLTSLTSQLEVSLMDKELSKESRQLLESFLNEIKNLNLLSNGLLDLTQADQDISEIRLLPIRIDEVVGQARAEVLKRNKNYKVLVSFKELPEDENKLVLTGNEHLLKVALVNLIENGCKYSSDEVLLIVSFIPDGINLEVIDTGIGIISADLSKVFEPFYRGENAKAIYGHGIGLALTQKIVELHKGEIKIASDLNKGTVVKVSLRH